MKLLLLFLGFVLIFEGIIPVIKPHEFKETILILTKLNDSELRLLGFISVIVGTTIIYLAKLLLYH